MRAIPIPDDHIPDGTTRHVLAEPGGDLTNPDIAPLEVVISDKDYEGLRLFASLWKLEDDDLAVLQKNGGKFWLTVYSPAHPVVAMVVDPVVPEGGANDGASG